MSGCLIRHMRPECECGDKCEIQEMIEDAVAEEREACARWLEANGQPGYAVEIRHRKS